MMGSERSQWLLTRVSAPEITAAEGKEKNNKKKKKTSGLSSAQAPGELEQVKRRQFDSTTSVQEFL